MPRHLNAAEKAKILTLLHDNTLIQYLRENPFKTAVLAQNVTDFPGSVRTAQRRIRYCSNLRNHPAAKKPFLTVTNKEWVMHCNITEVV